MNPNYVITFFILLSLLILFVGIVYLQIYLSRNQNKWLGLLIPMIFLAFSILIILSLETFTYRSSVLVETIVDGEVVEIIQHKVKTIPLIMMFATYFFILNIPTLILLAVYYAERGKIKRQYELHKMSIQDL